FQAEDGIRDGHVTGVQTCALPIFLSIVAAKLGSAKVYGVDLSQRAVEAARENARRLGLDHICEFRAGDLLEPVRDVRANVLIGEDRKSVVEGKSGVLSGGDSSRRK